jgi:hypothetical protein
MASSTNEKLNLQSLLSNNNDFVDNTDMIRKLKHSNLIASDITKMESLKKDYAGLLKSNKTEFDEMVQQQCNFLYTYYTDIYIRLLRDELNIDLMTKFLIILQNIENGVLTQNDASVQVGTILKEMYVDSAIRRGENLDKETPKVELNDGMNISWKEYKNYIM